MGKHMESAWKQLDQYVDLYKFHWDLCIKLNLFTLGISGAMSAYVLKNQGLPLMEYALFLPILLSAFMAWLAHRSTPGVILIRDEVRKLAQQLQLDTHPEFRSLVSFLFATKVLCALSALGLLGLFWVVALQHS